LWAVVGVGDFSDLGVEKKSVGRMEKKAGRRERVMVYIP
jgi:hypothetical protein